MNDARRAVVKAILKHVALVDRLMGGTNIVFSCNICGVRSPQPVLCVRDDCATESLVCGEASPVIN